MTDSIRIIVDTSVQTIEIKENAGAPVNIVEQTGGGLIDGVPVVVTNPALGDVISYDGAIFRNRKQTELTDGGNF